MTGFHRKSSDILVQMSAEASKDFPERSGNDMREDWRGDVISLFKEAISVCDSENDVAQKIKQAFENKRSGIWHCIVGKSFGSAVVYEEQTHFADQVGPFMIELWRCG